MRILQVVTLVSPDGAFGGPVRVAVNQSRELIQRGHDVTLVAGARGFATMPTRIAEVPARLFPVETLGGALGFAGYSSSAMRTWLRRELEAFDIAHIHLARDLVTLPAALRASRARVPYVLQTHGMVDASSRLLARPLDRWATLPVLRGASSVFFLTPREEEDLKALTSGLRLRHLQNGVPGTAPARITPRAKPDFLFMARLHRRKNPGVFVEAARLALRSCDATFSVVGPDEGELPAVRRAIAEGDDRVVYEGPLAPERTMARIGSADVLVLPSVDEPLGMVVLEAMSAGIAVIVTESCGLAPLVREAAAGLVVADNDPAALAAAMTSLAHDAAERREMGAAGRRLVATRFSMQSVADRLVAAYEQARAA